MPLWTLNEAVTLVQAIEPEVRGLGYHTMLGGGVLHRGASDKDLDLFVCRFDQARENKGGVIDFLTARFGPLAPAGKEYEEVDCALWLILTGAYTGKRVDLFIR